MSLISRAVRAGDKKQSLHILDPQKFASLGMARMCNRKNGMQQSKVVLANNPDSIPSIECRIILINTVFYCLKLGKKLILMCS